MCNYFSVGITRTHIETKTGSKVISLRKGNVKAFYLLSSSNHNDIFEATTLTKQFDRDEVNREFVRVEIAPKNKAKITRDKNDWLFKIDQDDKTVPSWFLENKLDAEALAWEAWQQSITTQVILAGEVVQEVKDIEIGYLTGEVKFVSGSAKITDVRDSAKITDVSGSAKITDVSGSAQITDVSGSAQITDVSGLAQITYVRDSAKITDVSDSAQITYVSDSAKITDVSGSAQITYVSGSAQITDVRDSAQITYVSDSAQITYVRDSAKITDVSGSAKITYVSGSAQITYVRDSAKITDVSDSAKILQIKDFATVRKENTLYVSKTVKIKRVSKQGIY